MRTMMSTLILGFVLAAPVAAQDTSVVIMNGDCTVKVNGKELSEKDAKAACARMKISTEKMRLQVEKMGSEMGVLRERLLDQSELFTLQGKALESQGALMRLRSNELPEVALRLQDEAGKLRELNFTGRPLAAFAARPRFGITIDTRPRDTDRYGAYITAVTPGGPADKAGIQSGDVIVKVGSEAVAKVKEDETPSVRLIALIGKLEVGKAVGVELRRKNETKKVKVTPENDDNFFSGTIAGNGNFEFSPRSGSGYSITMPNSDEMMKFREISPGRPITSVFTNDQFDEPSFRYNIATGAYSSSLLGGIEMVSLNADLGSYFGTSEGVLILDVGKNAALGLLAGDVVLSVDGRKVSSPSALTRIIRSYEKGDSFKLQIMRQKKNETVTAKP